MQIVQLEQCNIEELNTYFNAYIGQIRLHPIPTIRYEERYMSNIHIWFARGHKGPDVSR